MNKQTKKSLDVISLISMNDVIWDILMYVKENQPTSVTPIYHELKLEQSVVSTFLGKLRRAGLVKGKRDGKKIYYSVDHHQILQHFQIIGGEFLTKES